MNSYTVEMAGYGTPDGVSDVLMVPSDLSGGTEAVTMEAGKEYAFITEAAGGAPFQDVTIYEWVAVGTPPILNVVLDADDELSVRGTAPFFMVGMLGRVGSQGLTAVNFGLLLSLHQVMEAGMTQAVTDIWTAINALSGGGPVAPSLPPALTPMEDVAWDGTHDTHISADTTSQDIIVTVPSDATTAGALTVKHRNDGGTGNTVTVRHDGNDLVTLAVGDSAFVRSLGGGYDVL